MVANAPPHPFRERAIQSRALPLASDCEPSIEPRP